MLDTWLMWCKLWFDCSIKFPIGLLVALLLLAKRCRFWCMPQPIITMTQQTNNKLILEATPCSTINNQHRKTQPQAQSTSTSDLFLQWSLPINIKHQKARLDSNQSYVPNVNTCACCFPHHSNPKLLSWDLSSSHISASLVALLSQLKQEVGLIHWHFNSMALGGHKQSSGFTRQSPHLIAITVNALDHTERVTLLSNVQPRRAANNVHSIAHVPSHHQYHGYEWTQKSM